MLWYLGCGMVRSTVIRCYGVPYRYRGVSFLSPRGVIHMISELVGGVLIAGVMSWYLYRAIAATGALDRFASGRALRDDADRRG